MSGATDAVLPAGLLRGPKTVAFGAGQRHAVPGLVRATSGGSVLVVTDPRLGDSPQLTELVDGLRAAGVTTRVFDEAAPELPLDQVPQALDVARRGGAELLVGFGGGSCIDLAKVVALVLAHGGSVRDHYGENQVPGPDRAGRRDPHHGRHRLGGDAGRGPHRPGAHRARSASPART